jgi:hypothetical protein
MGKIDTPPKACPEFATERRLAVIVQNKDLPLLRDVMEWL